MRLQTFLNNSSSVFFFSMVTWRVPLRSLRMRKAIEPSSLTSWTQPATVISFPCSACVTSVE